MARTPAPDGYAAYPVVEADPLRYILAPLVPVELSWNCTPTMIMYEPALNENRSATFTIDVPLAIDFEPSALVTLPILDPCPNACTPLICEFPMLIYGVPLL